MRAAVPKEQRERQRQSSATTGFGPWSAPKAHKLDHEPRNAVARKKDPCQHPWLFQRASPHGEVQ